MGIKGGAVLLNLELDFDVLERVEHDVRSRRTDHPADAVDPHLLTVSLTSAAHLLLRF